MLRLLHCHSFRKQIRLLNPENSTIFSNLLCTAIVYGYFGRLKMWCYEIGHNNRIVFACSRIYFHFNFNLTNWSHDTFCLWSLITSSRQFSNYQLYRRWKTNQYESLYKIHLFISNNWNRCDKWMPHTGKHSF